MENQQMDARKGNGTESRVRVPSEVRRALDLTNVQRGRLELLEAGLLEQYQLFEEQRRIEEKEAAAEIAKETELETLRERISYLESREEAAGKRALFSALGGGAYGVLIGAVLSAALTPRATIKSVIKDRIGEWLLG
jgi:uncharacterized membrane protein YdbT with pleckstrin-like domain